MAEAEASPFDLDQITEDEVDEPVRPAPLYDLEALDAVLSRPDLLPPGIEARPFHSGEYVYSQPGLREPLRVTTSARISKNSPKAWNCGHRAVPCFRIMTQHQMRLLWQRSTRTRPCNRFGIAMATRSR